MAEGMLSRNGEIRIDEFGYVHSLRKELSRGGQGVVYRTKDPDIAIKQPLNPNTGEIDLDSDMGRVFRGVRSLPMPKGVRVALPLSILRPGPDGPGYVMKLLRNMESLDCVFYLKKSDKERILSGGLPLWLEGLPEEQALPLANYVRTGSMRKRLMALAGCAATLARLHANGLVYCDLSPNNVFVNPKTDEVWLIDADNLRFEQKKGGASVFTPRFGAPEVVQGTDSSRAVSDSWSFAVMAFEIMTINHPFIGKRVLGPNDSECGWDCEEKDDTSDFEGLDEKAYAGYFPFVDDVEDDSNETCGTGLPRELVLSPTLRWMFQQTLGYGRINPSKRIALDLWSMALAQAHDHSIVCPECKMSYYNTETTCPYCDSPNPPYAIIESDYWDMVVQEGAEELTIPHRLIHPYNLQGFNDETEFHAAINFRRKTVEPVWGYPMLPNHLTFKFHEED